MVISARCFRHRRFYNTFLYILLLQMYSTNVFLLLPSPSPLLEVLILCSTRVFLRLLFPTNHVACSLGLRV